VVVVTSSEVRFQDKVPDLDFVLTLVLFDLFSFVYQLLDLNYILSLLFVSIVDLLFMIRLVLDL
jgi:hypothetical protein